MKFNYRSLARQAVDRSQALLDAGADDQLRHAALELRLAMEALTYDRAQAYSKELPLEALSTWQPQRLMDALLEIDPTADTTSTIRVGEEPAPGIAPESMITLGTDTVFGLRDLKKHYHAAGSFLHMPSMQQVEDGRVWDPNQVRPRLQALANALATSLGSKIWNANFGVFSNFDCFRCNKPIHKRVPNGDARLIAKCIHCNAAHEGSRCEDGTMAWVAQTRDVKCPTKDCDHDIRLFLDEIKPGTHWSCAQCHKSFRIDYGIYPGTATHELNESNECAASQDANSRQDCPKHLTFTLN